MRAALASSQFDADGCGDTHTYDENCSWRSAIERQGHLAAAAMVRLGYPKLLDIELAEAITADVIDAIYAEGLVIARSGAPMADRAEQVEAELCVAEGCIWNTSHPTGLCQEHREVRDVLLWEAIREFFFEKFLQGDQGDEWTDEIVKIVQEHR